MKRTKMILACLLVLSLLAAIPVLATELDLSPIYVGRVKLEAVPVRWNPMEEGNPGSDAILALTAQTLYSTDDQGNLLPDQAEELPRDITAEYAGTYGIPKNAKRGYAFAISIREDAAWEDGKSVNGADWYFTVEKWLEANRFPLEIANYQAFLRGDTKPADQIISLKEAGFSSVSEAEAAGHSDFYIDLAGFWGLDTGWLRITDRTPLEDAAIPSGCEEMYLTAEYIYRRYLSDSGSQKMFQSEFVGIPSAAGEKLTVQDVGLIAEGNSIVLILHQPAAAGYVAAALADLVPLRPSAFGDDYGTGENYVSCGPYRIVSASGEEILLEPNPHWAGEPAEAGKVICRAGG